MELKVDWRLLPFAALTAHELYDVLTLRQRVFVVEQSCIYLDCDGADAEALHLLGMAADPEDPSRLALLAYARLFPPGVKYAEASIGRVTSDPRVRRTGAGRALMREAIAQARASYGNVPIRIGAQRYVERFYASLGFEVSGDPYIEDGIPHIEMLLRAAP